MTHSVLLGITIILHIIVTEAAHRQVTNGSRFVGTTTRTRNRGFVPYLPLNTGTTQFNERPPGAVTDIPEEREIGEDVTTGIGGITQSTPAEDPVEQHDLSPGATGHQRQTTQYRYNQGQTTPYRYQTTTPEAEEIEAEDMLPGTGNCPLFDDVTKEHHVIIKHENCEIFISHDDSIRWFGEPGLSAPSVYVRNFV